MSFEQGIFFFFIPMVFFPKARSSLNLTESFFDWGGFRFCVMKKHVVDYFTEVHCLFVFCFFFSWQIKVVAWLTAELCCLCMILSLQNENEFYKYCH